MNIFVSHKLPSAVIARLESAGTVEVFQGESTITPEQLRDAVAGKHALITMLTERVDGALSKTDATAEQKKKVAEILQSAMKDMKPFRDQRVENRKALEAAMQAPTLDAARIEQLRAEQVKIADASSKRFTQALVDAGNVLSPAQRQAFFKAWSERHGDRMGRKHG